MNLAYQRVRFFRVHYRYKWDWWLYTPSTEPNLGVRKLWPSWWVGPKVKKGLENATATKMELAMLCNSQRNICPAA